MNTKTNNLNNKPLIWRSATTINILTAWTLKALTIINRHTAWTIISVGVLTISILILTWIITEKIITEAKQ